MPVTKATAKKAASKKASNKKNADSDEDDYVPEKEEPDEALDIKLEEEADDIVPAEDDQEEEVVSTKKRGERGKVSKSRKKKERKSSGRTIVRVDPETLEHKRVPDTHVESDVGDPMFEMQLVEFLESGKCPKCHSTLKKAHERHLKLCVLIGDIMDAPCVLAAFVSHLSLNFVINTAAGAPRKTQSDETTKGRSWQPCRQRCSS